MELLTKQEFLQYVKENEVDVTVQDFDGVDIDDFVRYGYLTSEWVTHQNLVKLLECYKRDLVNEQGSKIMAKEIICVDSTDEEYEAFLKAYFNAVDGEYWKYGARQKYQFESYTIRKDDVRCRIEIGKTKNMSMYKIFDGRFYGNLEIDIPDGDASWRLPFCYSADGKFFMFTDEYGYDGYIYELFTLFTKTNTPQ